MSIKSSSDCALAPNHVASSVSQLEDFHSTSSSQIRVSRRQERRRREATFASIFPSLKLTTNGGLLCAIRREDLSGDLSTVLSARSVKTQHLHAAIPNLFSEASFENALSELRKRSNRGLSWEECGMTDELALRAFTGIDCGAQNESTIVSSINGRIFLQAAKAGFEYTNTVINDLVGFSGGLAYIDKPGDPKGKAAYVGEADLSGMCGDGQKKIGWVITAECKLKLTDDNNESVFSSDSLVPQGVCSLFGSDTNFCLLLTRTGYTLLFRVQDADFAPMAHAPQQRFKYYKIHNGNTMLSFKETSNVVKFIKILHEFARISGVSGEIDFSCRTQNPSNTFAIAVDGENDLIVAPVNFDEFGPEDIAKIDEVFSLEKEKEWRQNV